MKNFLAIIALFASAVFAGGVNWANSGSTSITVNPGYDTAYTESLIHDSLTAGTGAWSARSFHGDSVFSDVYFEALGYSHITQANLDTIIVQGDGPFVAIRATGSHATFQVPVSMSAGLLVENYPAQIDSQLHLATDTARANILTVTGKTESGKFSVGNAAPTIPVQVGANDPRTTDGQIGVTRDVVGDSGVNGHAFGDWSVVNRAGRVGINSYDAFPKFTGAHGYDHYAAFQARPTYSSDSLIKQIYGGISTALVDTGTVDTVFGWYTDAPAATSLGAINNKYSFYAKEGSGTAYFGDSTIIHKDLVIFPKAGTNDNGLQIWEADAGNISFRIFSGNTQSYMELYAGGVEKVLIDPAGPSHFNGGDVSTTGNMEAATYSVGGDAGASCTGTSITAITVVNGIVTSCTAL